MGDDLVGRIKVLQEENERLRSLQDLMMRVYGVEGKDAVAVAQKNIELQERLLEMEYALAFMRKTVPFEL